MINKILDATIYFSFDKSGFRRHEKNFESLKKKPYQNKTILITGGTSGIGLSVAVELYHLGAEVIVTGRDEEKYKQNLSQLDLSTEDINFLHLDLLDFESLPKFISTVENNIKHIDTFICNAGAMPDKKNLIRSYDSIFASQVVAHYYLIRKFIERDLIQGGHISLNSSGGMYPVKLDLSDLTWDKSEYDKVNSYAIAKRSQVILNEEMASDYPEYLFSCSHPGWVDTPGLKDSLESFWKFAKNRLRSPLEGGDTLVWLAGRDNKLESGKFWFDRKVRSVYLFPFTKEDPQERNKLKELLDKEFHYIDSLNKG